jgi:hypothetical protein
LISLLSMQHDTAFAQRFARVAEASAAGVAALAELDLSKFEIWPVENSADLSVWEELAPVVGTTIATMNALISELAACFPPGQTQSSAQSATVDRLIRAAGDDLRTEVARFGMQIRDPSVVGDRWSLLFELQTVRQKIRGRIGAMIYDAVSQLGDCKRSEVEPGYAEELASTLVIRSTTADLRRLVHSRIEQINGALDEDVEWSAKQFDKELNSFARTAAWRVLRAQDKRVILEFRHRLTTLIARSGFSRFELFNLLEPFVEFVDAFSAVNQRDLLVQHDLEVVASVGVILEHAMSSGSPDEQLRVFNEAVGQAQSVYGRNPEFDTFLRKLRKKAITPDQVPGELEQFVVLLAAMAQY